LSLNLKEEEEGLFTITEGREFQRGIMSIKNDDLWLFSRWNNVSGKNV